MAQCCAAFDEVAVWSCQSSRRGSKKEIGRERRKVAERGVDERVGPRKARILSGG